MLNLLNIRLSLVPTKITRIPIDVLFMILQASLIDVCLVNGEFVVTLAGEVVATGKVSMFFKSCGKTSACG